jgi:hypothetical protein
MTGNQKLGVAIVGIIVVVLLWRPGQRSTAPTPATIKSQPIPYKTVEGWRIGPGKNGRVIVIDSVYRTDSSLRRLGEELHREHPNDLILVYTDTFAAFQRNQGDLDKLPAAEQRRYDRSLVASTTVVPNTWLFSVDGIRQDPDTSLTQINFPP